MEKIQSFGPVIHKDSRILILGSIPGIASLRAGEYYAHPQNQFWRILFILFESPLERDYTKKLTLLQSRGIALWDVVQSCYRAGSLDTNIQGETLNDFAGLFAEYPGIQAVFFNGTKGYDMFRKKVGFERWSGKRWELLPSTSPARTIPLEQKLTQWSKILTYIKV